MIKYLFPFFTLFLIGCNMSKDENYAYFGGKIINPKGDFVTLSNHNGLVDSIPLKSDNTFLKKLRNIKKGLYFFKHGGEIQYVFLEPNDSLLIRLNTWDFDESLVFSGTNASRNNILLETFLQNEKEENDFYSFYNLSIKSFTSKIDSLKAVKRKFIEDYKVNNSEISKEFLNIFTIANLYPVYRKAESYSMQRKLDNDTQKKDIQSLLSYRSRINTELDSLMFFSPYNNLIINQLYNDTYLEGHKMYSNKFNNALLENINKKIKTEKLRNKLLRQVTISNFYKNSSCNFDTKTFDTFFALCTDDACKKELKYLMNDAQSLQKKDTLPEFKIYGPNGSLENITTIVNGKNTVIYFRNPKHSSNDWVASRLNFFIKNNPKTNFLVVNINEDSKNYIKNLPIKHQYYLPKESTAHKFLTSKLSRILLVDKNGIIENGFGGLSSEKIENQIASLQKS